MLIRISREPCRVGKGVAAITEQASEHCTEKQFCIVGCNGSNRYLCRV